MKKTVIALLLALLLVLCGCSSQTNNNDEGVSSAETSSDLAVEQDADQNAKGTTLSELEGGKDNSDSYSFENGGTDNAQSTTNNGEYDSSQKQEPSDTTQDSSQTGEREFPVIPMP